MNSSLSSGKSVAIVDNHRIVREGFELRLSKYPFIGRIELFNDSASLFERMHSQSFDLIMLDVLLNGENGLDVCKKIKEAYKDVKVLMVSGYCYPEYILEAERNGAGGYLFKDE